MRIAFVLVFLFLGCSCFGQKMQQFFYESGELKSQVTTDATGVMIKYSSWDAFGNLLEAKDYATLYKDYPRKDFSRIIWTPVTKGVGISKFNPIEKSEAIYDSSFVVFHYQCYLTDGKMLDNSFAKNCPLQIRLNSMPGGMVAGVKKMKVGETALIRLDPEVAFGDKASGTVPANSTLIYLVKLLSVD